MAYHVTEQLLRIPLQSLQFRVNLAYDVRLRINLSAHERTQAE